MGEQMTREQIEAWLALEGWEPVQSRGYVPMFKRHNKLAFVNNTGEPRYRPIRGVEDPEDFEPISNYFADSELQLIYQEIIKHEKD